MSNSETQIENGVVQSPGIVDGEARAQTGAVAWLKQHLPMIVLIGVMIAIIIPLSPAFRPNPSRDASVYLYSGQQILKGALPYRDLWDHRPPGLFYLNALGLALSGGSIWGVWVLEALCLCSAVALSYSLLRRAFDGLSAFLATFVWIVSLPLMYNFDLSEEFALLFQFAALYCFFRAESRQRYRLDSFIIGFCLGCSMNLRPNLVGVWMGIILYLGLRALATRRLGDGLRPLLWMFFGWLAPNAVVVIYFGAVGQLSGLWEAAYVFNFAYANTTWAYRFDAFKMGLGLLAQSGILFGALGGWFIGLARLIRTRFVLTPVNALLIVALLLLPIELFLSSLSGRLYQHYFISPLPCMAILTAALLQALFRRIRSGSPPRYRWVPSAVVTAAIIIAAPILPLQSDQLPPTSANSPQGLQTFMARAMDIRTRPTDTILVWGAEASIYFSSQRVAASRFINNYTLFMPGYSTPELIASYLDELKAHSPAYIIDTSRTDGRFSPLDRTGRIAWLRQKATDTRQLAELSDFVPVPAMGLIFNYVDFNYHVVGTPGGDGGWVIWQRNDFIPPPEHPSP